MRYRIRYQYQSVCSYNDETKKIGTDDVCACFIYLDTNCPLVRNQKE